MNPLRQRRPRSKQPLAIAPVDRNNPITQGLRAVFVGSMAYDPITGRRFADSAPNGRTMGKAGLGVDGRIAQAKLVLGGPSLSTGSMFVVFETSDPTTEQIVLEAGPDGSFTAGVRGIRFIAGQVSTYVRNFYDLISTGVYRTDTPIKVGTTYAGASANLYVNGALDRSGTTADTTSSADIFNVGGITGQTAYNLRGRVSIALLWDRVVSAGEMASLAANEWQLWPAESPLTSAMVPAIGAALTGAAAAVVSAYGALATSIPLAGAALVRADAAGTLSTSVQLAGSAKQRPTAIGSLSGGAAPLAGAVSARAAAIGELSTAILLAGSALARSVAAGDLAGGPASLSGAITIRAAAAGSLSTSIKLVAAAVARAYGAGKLSSRIALNGSTSTAATAASALTAGRAPSQIDILKVSPARIVTFDGSGSRIVVFEGSGKRLRINEMSAKVPTKDGDKWMCNRDPDEESYYAADITNELTDRFTSVKDSSDAIEILVHGVEQVGAHSIQVAEVDGVERTFVVVFLVGLDADPPDDWHWLARVRCANGERFDKTTWFKRMDT